VPPNKARPLFEQNLANAWLDSLSMENGCALQNGFYIFYMFGALHLYEFYILRGKRLILPSRKLENEPPQTRVIGGTNDLDANGMGTAGASLWTGKRRPCGRAPGVETYRFSAAVSVYRLPVGDNASRGHAPKRVDLDGL
jgi:hypothetical protein